MAAQDKTGALAGMIADVLLPRIEPLFASNAAQCAMILNKLNALEAKLAAVEAATTGTKAPKKEVRTAASGGAAAAAAPKSAAKPATNVLIFFKKECSVNPTFRAVHLKPDVVNMYKGSASASKHPEGSEKFYSAIAAEHWKTLSDDKKKEVRALLNTATEAAQTTASAPLQVEDDTDDE